MAGKLVTIATFDAPAKARLAQNALTDAGISARRGIMAAHLEPAYAGTVGDRSLGLIRASIENDRCAGTTISTSASRQIR